MLAAGALVASLLAVGPAPAGAVKIETGDDNKAEPSVEADFSACVGDALDDAGFTDLGTLEAAVDDINCLAYYRITTGRTADTFDPSSNVSRRHMALFLYRAASAAGVDLMGGDMDADFGDIADLGEDRQNAINALARNGILAGRDDMAFAPYDDITRAEMAVALVNLTRHTAPQKFHQSGIRKGELIIAQSDRDYFSDSRASVPIAVDIHISYLYELGVTTGYDDATFRPNDGVPRRNMATFIMRALDHSNLRPAGLSVQSDSGTLTVSIRDADFAPVANEPVDAFYVSDARVDRAFNNDGECRSIISGVDMGDSCEIDSLDPATDADGNTQLEPLGSEQIGKGITVWVWSGDVGDEVDEDTDLIEFAQGPVVTPASASKTVVSPTQAKTPRARFGAAVEFTAQLQYVDDRDSPSSADDLDKNTAVGDDGKSRAEYSLTISVYSGQLIGLDVASDTGVIDDPTYAGDDAGGLVSRSASETLKTDSDGKVNFSVTTSDPDPRPVSERDYRTVVWVLTSGKNAPGTVYDDPTTDADETASLSTGGYVVFAEDASAVSAVKVTAINGYAEAPRTGSSSNNGVVVTVLDQYQRPMRGQAIRLTSSANLGISDTDDYQSILPGARHTASSGSVRITYSYKGTAPGAEQLTATWNGDAVGEDSGCFDPEDPDPADADRCGMALIYWTLRTEIATTDAASYPIVAGSLDNDEVVVDQDGDVGDPNTTAIPWLVRYDGNDIFVIGTNYVDIEAFETALGKILDPDNEDVQTNTGKLAWDSYDHNDEDDRTLFTLTVPAS